MEQSKITGAAGGAASGAAIGTQIMPGWGTAIGAVVGGIGGLLSGGGEDDAKKMAEEQARMIEMQGREEQRRKIIQMNTQVGETKARTFASGLQDSGSTKKYRNAMESEYRRELAYDRFVTKKQAEFALEGGEAAADSISRAGMGSMIQSFGSAAASSFGGFGGTEASSASGMGVATTSGTKTNDYMKSIGAF